jgi:hypothetical protein
MQKQGAVLQKGGQEVHKKQAIGRAARPKGERERKRAARFGPFRPALVECWSDIQAFGSVYVWVHTS